jgi:hypothetical protein
MRYWQIFEDGDPVAILTAATAAKAIKSYQPAPGSKPDISAAPSTFDPADIEGYETPSSVTSG